MHVNYRYCLERAQISGGPILDFGCGGGEIVKAGLEAGLDIYGADSFYTDSPAHLAAVASLLGTRIVRIDNDRLPFPDGFFQTVVSNTVFEHVQDLDAVLAEIARVLKPGGHLLAIFPSKEACFEGHCRVFFAHRLLKWPTIFRLYMTAAHFLGYGANRDGKTRRQWVEDLAHWLKSYTAYRTISQLHRIFSAHGFRVRHAEADYMRYRWRRVIMPAFAYRRLVGLVFDGVRA